MGSPSIRQHFADRCDSRRGCASHPLRWRDRSSIGRPTRSADRQHPDIRCCDFHPTDDRLGTRGDSDDVQRRRSRRHIRAVRHQCRPPDRHPRQHWFHRRFLRFRSRLRLSDRTTRCPACATS